MHCEVTLERLKDFHGGALNDEEMESLGNHIDDCASCQQNLEALGSSDSLLSKPSPSAATLSFDEKSQAFVDRLIELGPPERKPIFPALLTGEEGLGRLGKYLVKEEIGRGTYGFVYKAVDTVLGRHCAIKVLKPDIAEHPKAVARFEEEARKAAQAKHEHVVVVFEALSASAEFPWPAFVMELVSGGTLATMLQEKGGRLDPRTATLTARQIASGLAYAHSRGLVHRDIKPKNLLVDEHSRKIKIADFGTVRVQETIPVPEGGSIQGTPAYMSPEQFEEPDKVGPESDVYNLGATLYELVTGKPPFDTYLRKSQEPSPPRQLNPDVPRDLESVILKCLAIGATQRYTAAALKAELDRFLLDKPVDAHSYSYRELFVLWHRRSPGVVHSLGVVALVALIAVGGLVWGWSSELKTTQLQLADEKRKSDEERKRHQKQLETTEAVNLAIDKAKRLWDDARKYPNDEMKLQPAIAAAHEADLIVQTGVADEAIRQRVSVFNSDLQRAVAEARLLAAFDRARLLKVQLLLVPVIGEQAMQGWVNEGEFVNAPAEKTYIAAFKDYGLDLDKMSNREVIGKLQTCSPHLRRETAAAMTELALLRGGLAVLKNTWGKAPINDPRAKKWVRFYLMAQELDDDPWRNNFRKTLLNTEALLFGIKMGDMIRTASRQELSPSSVCFLAEILGAVSLTTDAIMLLRLAEHRFPDELRICCYLALLEAHREKPSWSDVAASYRVTIALQPNSAVLRNNLAIACFHLNKNHDALVHFEKATKLDPTFDQSWYGLGVVQYRLGKHAQAAFSWRKTLEVGPRSGPVLTNLATVLSGWGEVEEALTLVKESLQMDPNNPVTHFCYANLLVDTPELPKALTHYRRALELNENFLEAHTHLGLALIGQSAFAEALKHLERAHKLMTPNGHPQRDRVARFILSCKRQQDFDKKLKLLISGDLVPQTWEDQLDAARVASRHKAHATAVRLYSAALAQHKSAFNDGTRWAAACSAVLAGCGETTEPLESRERDNLRGQALRWLRDELELAKTMVEDAENVDALIPVAERLKSWQGDPRLVGVRDEQRLTRFSQAERNAWNTFWAEVNQLLLSAKRKRLNAKT